MFNIFKSKGKQIERNSEVRKSLRYGYTYIFSLTLRDYIESLKGDSETVSGGIQKAAWDRECETLKFKRNKIKGEQKCTKARVKKISNCYGKDHIYSYICRKPTNVS